MSTTAQEIALMKRDIETLSAGVEQLNGKIDRLTKQLLDPDDGFVVRVNKNTAFRESHDKEMPGYLAIIDDFKELLRWKGTVSKALWVL